MHVKFEAGDCIVPLPADTIDKYFPQEVFVHICLSQSITDVKKFVAALSHCARHGIDVFPDKRAW